MKFRILICAALILSFASPVLARQLKMDETALGASDCSGHRLTNKLQIGISGSRQGDGGPVSQSSAN